MRYRTMAMTDIAMSAMDDSLVDIVLSGTHGIGERQPLGKLSSKSR